MSAGNINDNGFPQDEDRSSHYGSEEEEDYTEYDEGEGSYRSHERESQHGDDDRSFEEKEEDYYDDRHRHDDSYNDSYNENDEQRRDRNDEEEEEEEEEDSYETDPDYNEDEEEEPSEHDDIQSSMTPYDLEEPTKKKAHPQSNSTSNNNSNNYVDEMQTPTREEVEKVRMNYANNFGYPKLENQTDSAANIPKTSRSSTTSTSSSRRGRSPTPKEQPPPTYYSRQPSANSEDSTSSQTPLLQKPKLEHKKSGTEDAIDCIQATVGDATYSFRQEQEHQKPQSSTSLPNPEQPPSTPDMSKPKSALGVVQTTNRNGTMTATAATAANATSTVPVSPNDTSSKKSPLKSSTHSLKRRSSHRKSTTTAGAPRISWKSDPHESFSDWTVKVLFDDLMDIYHVHRNIMGFGHRKSVYFEREFRRQQQQAIRDTGEDARVSHIKLPAAYAKVFPMVLDFIYYTKEAKQTLTAERACNVFKLAETLEIPALQKAIADFYANNLSLRNLGEFLLAASKAKVDRLLIVSKAKIGQMITEKPELSGLVPPKFMADILLISHRQLEEARAREPNKYTEELVQSQSRYWSKAACICAAHNESVLTPKLFEDLTSEESLPHIDSSVAPKLLLMDAKFNGKNNGDMEPSSLQRRCIDSITDDFQHFQTGFTAPEDCARVLKELPSNVLAEILIKTMKFSS
jgi:BTB/POZ domain